MSIVKLAELLSFSVCLLSIITLIEVSTQFRRPLYLKIWVLMYLIATCVLSATYFRNDFTDLSFAVNIFSRAMTFVAVLNIASCLFNPSFKNKTLMMSIFILVTSLTTIYSKLVFFNSTNESNSNVFFIQPETYLPLVLLIVRGVLIVLYFSFFIYIIYNTFKKFTVNNMYHIRLKKWTTYILAAMILFISIFFIIQTRLIQSSGLKVVLMSVFSINMILVLLFRPKFINTSNPKFILSNLFNKTVYNNINDLGFVELFYNKSYFLDKEASLEHFAKINQLEAEEVYRYIYQNYSLTFSDLINKNRVEYFIEITKSLKFQQYTIEALAIEVGFSSRFQLYKPFKKFHGGTPSDYIDHITY